MAPFPIGAANFLSDHDAEQRLALRGGLAVRSVERCSAVEPGCAPAWPQARELARAAASGEGDPRLNLVPVLSRRRSAILETGS